MKRRFAPLLLILFAACSSTTAPSDNTIPTAQFSTAEPILVYLEATDFCQGSNAWWTIIFDVDGVDDLDHAKIVVYAVESDGARTFFGIAHEAGAGSAMRFYVTAKAPVLPMTDIWGEELPPNYGYMAFHFDVFNGRTFEGTGSNYSDVPLASNLCPGICAGVPHGSTPQIGTSCQ